MKEAITLTQFQRTAWAPFTPEVQETLIKFFAAQDEYRTLLQQLLDAGFDLEITDGSSDRGFTIQEGEICDGFNAFPKFVVFRGP